MDFPNTDVLCYALNYPNVNKYWDMAYLTGGSVCKDSSQSALSLPRLSHDVMRW